MTINFNIGIKENDPKKKALENSFITEIWLERHLRRLKISMGVVIVSWLTNLTLFIIGILQGGFWSISIFAVLTFHLWYIPRQIDMTKMHLEAEDCVQKSFRDPELNLLD